MKLSTDNVQKQIRALADHLPAAVVELDMDLRFTYMNKAAKNLLLLDDASLERGLVIEDVVVAEQLKLVREALSLLSTITERTPLSLRVIRGDKVQVPVEVYAELIKRDGESVGYIVTALDLSRRIHIEEKLETRAALFQQIVEYSSFTGILIVGEDYLFEYVNDKLCDLLGRKRSEVLGHDFREFIHPDSVDLVADRYVRRQKGEDVPSFYEFRGLYSDGTPRDFLIHSKTMKGPNGTVKTYAQILDVTEERARQRALEASEDRFRRLVETMSSGLGIDNIDGKIVYVNNALCRLLGYSHDELIGKDGIELIYGLTREVDREKKLARRAGKVEHYEAELVHKSGENIPAMISASPLYDSTGEYIGTFAIFTDVSQLKSTEAEVQFLLDLLLHDIGNQLQLITAGAGFLNEDSSAIEIVNAKHYIQDGARRCLEMVTNIRTAEESKRELLRGVDLIETLMAQVHLIARQYEVRPTIKDLPDRVVILADRGLGHLVWNVIENSIKHNPKTDKQVNISGDFVSDEYFELIISDNGPGMSQDKKNELFNSARRYGGVGVHLVRRLMDKYGGHLIATDCVEGKPDKGLCIKLQFRTSSS